MNEINAYGSWCQNASADPDLQVELKQMEGDQAKIEDAFYRDLAFGTGGLRGIIGAGTNRMNVYTVAKATQGLSDYLCRTAKSQPSVAVSYDSRIKSKLFAETAADVFAANGIHVYIYPQLMPVPCLSYAVRSLGCDAGVMITASHNPAKYNGYKVYGADGCQITSQAAEEILAEIEKLDIFHDIKKSVFTQAQLEQKITYIPQSVYRSFIECVKSQSMLFGESVDKNVSIVYSPLNGTGIYPVTIVLNESGFKQITVVKEQELPDGRFPTCPYPNPEIREAMSLGIQYAEKVNADLLLATDPDCDRCGIAVKDSNGSYRLLSGNETGLLLLDYICSRRKMTGHMPEHPVFVKTIVTMDLAEKIADHYGVETINVLTGFKYIGEQIGILEKEGCASDYICGLEESYGYLTGTYVRDKDGVDAVFMICEMFAYYKTKHISLLQKLQEIYDQYGYCMNTLHSYEFDGSTGFHKMTQVMQSFRNHTSELAGIKVEKILDYSTGLNGLPKSDVLKFILTKGSSIVVRPSGTEPKLKVYISIIDDNQAEASRQESILVKDLEKLIQI